MAQTGQHRNFDKAINALLATSTIEEAAKQAGLSRRTLLRWLKLPEFRTAYIQAKGEVLRTATGILTRNAGRAADTLAVIFSGLPEPHQSARVAAAVGTLRLSLDAFCLENLEARISALERQGDAL